MDMIVQLAGIVPTLIIVTIASGLNPIQKSMDKTLVSHAAPIEMPPSASQPRESRFVIQILGRLSESQDVVADASRKHERSSSMDSGDLMTLCNM